MDINSFDLHNDPVIIMRQVLFLVVLVLGTITITILLD
jgi:hypothetical protein